ncbi:MAG: sulfoxide reductase heme-binding subunit YedZ [Rubrivivax sp.]|nr:sulfoxide reductase heme-binding subunit YedZ [Rubrivivax sp.]
MQAFPASGRVPAGAGASPRAPKRNVNAVLLHPATKPLLFVLALVPFGSLLWGAVANTLGANPAEALIRGTGDWTLRFLCLTLAVTPLRQWSGWHALARLRRMLGLFTFFYGCWHFLAFAWLDMGFDLQAILKDIAKRPFILVGSAALLLMTPLAATSFNRAVKALGAARWQALHRLVYGIVLLALLHFFWMRAGKNDFGEWSVYAAIVALLLGWRAWRALRAARAKPVAQRPGASLTS